MIFDFKKIKKQRMISGISVLFLLMPVLIYLFYADNVPAVTNAGTAAPILVIDPGHGGIDSGAIAADGSKESDINLAIALKLRALAEFCGLDNALVRQEDITMSDTPDYSEHRDLQRRAEIVNSKNNCVYISIHQNCYPTGQPSGSLVIYSDRSDSEQLGKLTHSNLISSLNPDNRRIAEPANDKYYVLSHVDCPAILVECGFMSNFSEMERLKSPQYQTSVAAVLVASFIQYTQNAKYI